VSSSFFQPRGKLGYSSRKPFALVRLSARHAEKARSLPRELPPPQQIDKAIVPTSAENLGFDLFM
jgi:hypothetical protein